MVEVMKITVTSFKRLASAPDPLAGHRRATPPPETPGHAQASLDQSLVGLLLVSLGFWCSQGSLCAFPASVSPVLSKFEQLSGGVHGALL